MIYGMIPITISYSLLSSTDLQSVSKTSFRRNKMLALCLDRSGVSSGEGRWPVWLPKGTVKAISCSPKLSGFHWKDLPHFLKWAVLSEAGLKKTPIGRERKWVSWSLGFSTSYSKAQELAGLERFLQFPRIHLQWIMNKFLAHGLKLQHSYR